MSDVIRYETVSANGLSFNVATAGTGDRLALCLHGFPENSHSFRYQLPLFARLGYRAWAPDLRGYGKTTRPVGVAEYSIEKLEADVAGLIDASRAREVVLVGHDWGGGIAWSFASHAVRPIDRLIVMNCPHPRCFEKGLANPAQLLRSWYMFFFQLPVLPERYLGARHAERVGRAFRGMAVDKSRFPDDVLALYRDAASEPGALTAMVNYYRAMFREFRRIRARGFGEITTPTLLIWGEHDTALGKELTFDTSRYVRDLTIRYLPNVSHWVQQEAPEAVNRLMEEWLSERLPPAGG
jgi:pimeloyl-ACP methyl ester carboxylesterase